MAELTKKQKRFCQEYIIDLNGTQAAIRAGYSEKTADVQASRLLGNVKVKEYIQSLANKTTEKLEYTAEDVLNDIKDIIVANKEEDPKTALKGLELYGKYHKLFTDKVESTNLNLNHEMTDEEAEKILKQHGIDPEKV